MSRKPIKQQITQATDAMAKEVGSWMPKPKGWPEVGQAIRVTGGPYDGEDGIVVGSQDRMAFVRLNRFARLGDAEVISLTNTDWWEPV